MKAIAKNYNSLVEKYYDIEKEVSEKEIHTKRIILRRVFPILAACKINPAKIKNGEKAFKLFGKLRDIQVQILTLECIEQNEDTELYLEFLKQKEIKFQQKILSFSKQSRVVFPTIKKVKINKAKLTEKVLNGATKLVERTRQHPIDDASDVHKIRIELKKFRYLAEMLSYVAKIDESKLKMLKLYQDKLGKIQDYEVLITGINKFNKKRNSTEDSTTETLGIDQNTLIEEFDNETEKFMDLCKGILQPVLDDITITTTTHLE